METGVIDGKSQTPLRLADQGALVPGGFADFVQSRHIRIRQEVRVVVGSEPDDFVDARQVFAAN